MIISQYEHFVQSAIIPEGGPDTPGLRCLWPVTGLVLGLPGCVVICLGPGKIILGDTARAWLGFELPESSVVAWLADAWSRDAADWLSAVAGLALAADWWLRSIEMELDSTPWALYLRLTSGSALCLKSFSQINIHLIRFLLIPLGQKMVDYRINSNSTSTAKIEQSNNTSAKGCVIKSECIYNAANCQLY